jgi:hypothetical protein
MGHGDSAETWTLADGENKTVRESFDTVPLVNLHLEWMFPVKNE